MDVIKKVFTQTSFQLAGKAVTSLSTLLILSLITRNFGESGTGVYTLVLTYLSFFYLAADLGVNAYVLPKLHDSPNEANKLFNFRFFWSALLVVLAIVFLPFLPFATYEFNIAVIAGSATIIFTGIFNSVNLIFQNKLSYSRSVLSSSAGALAALPVIYFLILIKSPVQLLIIAPLFGWLVNNIIALILVKNYEKFSVELPQLLYVRNLIKDVWPISLSLLLNVVYFRADAFFISHFHSFADVGIYNLAYQVFQNILVIPTFIMNSYYPLMIRQLEHDKRVFFDHIKKASILIFLGSLMVMAAVLFFSPFAITILAGENNFSGSAFSLRILALSLPAYFVSAILMWTMLSLKKFKQMVSVYLFGLIVNIGLNILFVPTYSYVAASYITGISEYLILILQIIILFPELTKRYEIAN